MQSLQNKLSQIMLQVLDNFNIHVEDCSDIRFLVLSVVLVSFHLAQTSVQLVVV